MIKCATEESSHIASTHINEGETVLIYANNELL